MEERGREGGPERESCLESETCEKAVLIVPGLCAHGTKDQGRCWRTPEELWEVLQRSPLWRQGLL